MGWPFGKKKSREDRVKKFSERMMAARDSSDDLEPKKPKSPPPVSDQHNIVDFSDELELADDVDLGDINPVSDLEEPEPITGEGRSAADILKQLEGGSPAAVSDPLGGDGLLEDDLLIDTPGGKTESRDRLEDIDLDDLDSGVIDNIDDLDVEVNMESKQPSKKVVKPSNRMPSQPVSGEKLNENQRRIGRLLLAEGPFTRDALRNELESSNRLASPIAQVLLNTGAPEEDALLAFLLKNYRIPKVRLDGFRIPQHLRSALPKDLVKKYRIIPIDLVGDILCIAVDSIFELPVEAITEITRRTSYRVKIFSGDQDNIARLLGTVTSVSVLKPIKTSENELKGLVPMIPQPGYSAASFRYNYCGPGKLKPVPVRK